MVDLFEFPLYAAVYDAVMASTERRVLAPLRRRLLEGATGCILEIGAGTGANLPFLGRAHRIVASEPRQAMRERLRRRANEDGCRNIEILSSRAEALDLPDASVDVVVSTLVLCSVDDLALALAEARRVLRPDGRLLFIEHVRSSASWQACWQSLLTPVWKRVAGNCHLDRRTLDAMAGQGFDVEVQERVSLGGILPLAMGTARVPPEGLQSLPGSGPVRIC